MRLRSTAQPATLYAGIEPGDGDARRGNDAAMLAPGDGRVDPLLVAAFDMEAPYVVATRAIRSSIVRSYEGDDRRTRFCALVGLDCDEELAVMAANLAIVMVRMQSPTLLVDGNRTYPRINSLFHVPDQAVVQSTAIPDLWLVGTDDAAEAHAPVEGQPLVERSRDWNVPAAQVIAAMATGGNSSAASVAAALKGFDTVVILTRKHVTHRSAARGLIETLDEHRIPITGTVIV